MTGHKKNKKEYELLESLSSVPEDDNFDTNSLRVCVLKFVKNYV